MCIKMNFESQQRSPKVLRRPLTVAAVALVAIFGARLWAIQRETVHLTYRIVDPNTGQLVPNASAAITRARQPGFPLSAVVRLFPSLRPSVCSLRTKTVVGRAGIIDLGIAGASLGEYTLVFAARGYHSTEFTFCKEDDICRFRSYDPSLPTSFLVWSTNMFTLPLRQNFVPQSANGSQFYIRRPEFF